MTRKQHLAIEIERKQLESIVKLSVFSSVSEKLKFRSQHTNCMTYYDDVISYDVT